MSLEKRLPLALLLSFLILFGWQIVFPGPEPAPDAGEGARPGAEPTEPAPEGGGAPDVDAPVPDPGAAGDEGGEDVEDDDGASGGEPAIAEADPWAEWIELGEEGAAGHYFARFDSAGGTLRELRLGGYWVDEDLDDAARAQRDNRTPLLVPVRNRDAWRGTLGLRPGPSAAAVLGLELGEDGSGTPLDELHWEHERLEDGVVFRHGTPSGVVLEKEIRAVPDAYHLRVALVVRNEGASAIAGRRARFALAAALGVPVEANDAFYVEPKAVAARAGGEPEEKERDHTGDPRSGSLVEGDVAYVGAHNKYFAVLLRPAGENARRALVEASWRALFDQEWAAENPGRSRRGFRHVAADGTIEVVVPADGASTRYEYVLYAGPKSADAFEPGDEAFEKILSEDLGFFDGIAGLILRFLRFLHGIVGNWGWSIILLTFFVRLMLFPLNRRMQTSMARHATKMKRVQPRINAVKEKYKDDPQRLRQEQAKIIQEEGAIPPLGGCLPLFVQIPVFFGLFSALRVAFDLRQAPFLGWIEDLSRPDRLARIDLNTHLPFIGTIEYLNLLPILMVVMWIGQQRVMPKPTDEQALKMHRMMMWMPVLFGFFLYNYAAGLSLYMITSSLFGILEYTVVRRIWPIDDREVVRKKPGFMQRLAELQEQQQRAMQQQHGRGKSRGGGKGSRSARAKGGRRK